MYYNDLKRNAPHHNLTKICQLLYKENGFLLITTSELYNQTNTSTSQTVSRQPLRMFHIGRPIHLSFLRKDRATSSGHRQWENESRMKGMFKGLESLGLQAKWQGPGMVPEEPHGLWGPLGRVRSKIQSTWGHLSLGSQSPKPSSVRTHTRTARHRLCSGGWRFGDIGTVHCEQSLEITSMLQAGRVCVSCKSTEGPGHTRHSPECLHFVLSKPHNTKNPRKLLLSLSHKQLNVWEVKAHGHVRLTEFELLCFQNPSHFYYIKLLTQPLGNSRVVSGSSPKLLD